MSASPNSPGAVLPDPSVITGVNVPPFAMMPEPELLFARRAERFGVLARSHELAPYLTFLQDLAAAQAAILPDLPLPDLPEAEDRERARSFQMPPLDRSRSTADPVLDDTFTRLQRLAADVSMPPAAAAGLARLSASGDGVREEVMRNVLADSIPMEHLAEHVFAAAALQVHFARLAARLDPKSLVDVGVGMCPTCGGPPVSSVVVDWPNAHGARYCVCALCSTWWNFVRIRCTSCGTTKGIGYQEVEGSDGEIKAETCDACNTYLKVLYRPKNPDLDPVADDVGSLGLDLLMRDGPYRRSGFNPLLLGY
ncbi:formate dehydrogenase accessory protein FdhE [Xanthobacter pseudotagetidis]|uniref:formate dehydrogenase accessory protein FdhE n=1 Tax=Xanthobacter pseudotagetidis TaxID=3119911 RepID=UPI00372A222C